MIFLLIQINNEYVNNLFDVDISNSIIYGNQNIEFLVEKMDTDLMELNALQYTCKV